MKAFFSIYVASFIGIVTIIFFFGHIIFENIYYLIALVSLFLTVSIISLINLGDRVETLEKKLLDMDKKSENDEEIEDKDE